MTSKSKWLVIALLVGALASCKPIVDDPGEHLIVAHIVNNGSNSVKIEACGDDRCHDLPSSEVDKLNPGHKLPVNVNTEAGMVEVYRIKNGTAIRCLRFYATSKPVDSNIYVSQSVGCNVPGHRILLK